jgi:uncharacterized membrane protein
VQRRIENGENQAMTERRIETRVEINAPPGVVWALLTDFSGMPAWNPFIKSISGNLVQGGRLIVHIVPPGRSGMWFKPDCSRASPRTGTALVRPLAFAWRL